MTVAGRMRDRRYKADQHERRYEPHIEPFNRLVDELIDESGEWMPYVAPVYGGTNARILAIFRDPGPKTQVDKGSGMLSVENGDPSADRHLLMLEESGIDVADLMVWNTYPWYINRKPTSGEIDRGRAPLKRVIELLPNLKVVMAHGGDAQIAWRRFQRAHALTSRHLNLVETYHTSRQALRTPDLHVRAQREAKLRQDFAQAASYLSDC